MKLAELALRVIYGIIWPFIGMRVSIREYSMFPTIVPGEFILFDCLCYRASSPDRGDIVLVRDTWGTQESYVKRIVGIPGDMLAIKKGTLTINQSTYTWSSQNISHTLEEGPWTLGRNYYFLLGDALEWSADSRVFGPVHLDSILGKARLVYWPLSSTRKID